MKALTAVSGDTTGGTCRTVTYCLSFGSTFAMRLNVLHKLYVVKTFCVTLKRFMSRATRLNRTIRRAIERQLEKTTSTKPLLRSKAAKVLIFAIGIPGILAGVLSLLPRVTVTISDPVDAE